MSEKEKYEHLVRQLTQAGEPIDPRLEQLLRDWESQFEQENELARRSGQVSQRLLAIRVNA